MRDAGGAEHVPIRALDHVLVARDQRGDDAGKAARFGIARIAQNAVAHRLAPALDGPTAFGQAARRHIARAAAHVAGGAHALLPQPQLVVKTVRVQVAVRRLQTRGELPAVAGAQLGQQRARGVGLIGRAGRAVPGELQARWHAHLRAVELRLLHVEAKAPAGLALLRHAADGAGEQHVAPFQRGREAFGQHHGGAPAGRAEGGQRGGQQPPEGARRTRPGAPRQQRQRERENRHADVDARRPQHRLLHLQRRAQHPTQQRRSPRVAAPAQGVAPHVRFAGCFRRRHR